MAARGCQKGAGSEGVGWLSGRGLEEDQSGSSSCTAPVGVRGWPGDTAVGAGDPAPRPSSAQTFRGVSGEPFYSPH